MNSGSGISVTSCLRASERAAVLAFFTISSSSPRLCEPGCSARYAISSRSGFGILPRGSVPTSAIRSFAAGARSGSRSSLTCSTATQPFRSSDFRILSASGIFRFRCAADRDRAASICITSFSVSPSETEIESCFDASRPASVSE